MRRLETRIIALFVLLLLAMQLGALVITNATVANNVQASLVDKLRADERVLARLVELDRSRLVHAARGLAEDGALRDAIATRDPVAMQRLLARADAQAETQLTLLIDGDGQVLADVLPDSLAGFPFPLQALLAAAPEQGEASTIARLHGGLYQVVVVPVRQAARPAWILLGFSIDDEDTRLLHDLVGVDATYLTRDPEAGWQIVTTTLAPRGADELVTLLDAHPVEPTPDPVLWTLQDDGYLTTIQRPPDFGGQPTLIVLQRSVREHVLPSRQLEHELLEFAALATLVALACCIWVARGIVRPLRTLAAVARRVAAGEYGERIEIDRRDEIGDLAVAFDQMQDGITEREQKILDLAYRDALTGLPNRTLLGDRLEQALAIARRTASPVCLLAIDLDRFKEVNDLLGHRGGDALLVEVAARLKSVFKRTSDTIARMGGDEFAVLLPTEGPGEAPALVRALLRNLETPFVFEGHVVDIRASVGIAIHPEHGDDHATFSRNADSAMDVAKRTKSGYAMYDPQAERLSVERLSLMSELRCAVQRDEFVLFYQPKRELRDRGVLSVEALVRWQHPVRGLVGPDAFIPFAEQTGVISLITEWVLAKALTQRLAWNDEGLETRIAINISTRDLTARRFPIMVAALLCRHDCPASCLTLEITETSILSDPGLALANLQRLHELGCSLSIDDFGTGYSSLAYLKRLPVDELKIDKSFVMTLATESSDAVIVRSTIDLGHDMGLRVVAEGVETEEVLRQLDEMGCDVVQGYLIGRPLTATALRRWVEDAMPVGRQAPAPEAPVQPILRPERSVA